MFKCAFSYNQDEKGETGAMFYERNLDLMTLGKTRQGRREHLTGNVSY